ASNRGATSDSDRQPHQLGSPPPAFDPVSYKEHNTTERSINRLKAFRAVALRTGKCDCVYRGPIDVATTKSVSATPSTKLRQTRPRLSGGELASRTGCVGQTVIYRPT